MDQQKSQPIPDQGRDDKQDKQQAHDKTPGKQPPGSDQRNMQDQAGAQPPGHERENQKQR